MMEWEGQLGSNDSDSVISEGRYGIKWMLLIYRCKDGGILYDSYKMVI